MPEQKWLSACIPSRQRALVSFDGHLPLRSQKCDGADRYRSIGTQALLPPSAVLDLHFSPHSADREIAAVASSTGTLIFLRLNPTISAHSPLSVLKTNQVFDTDILILACAWHPTRTDIIGATTSTGDVYVLYLDRQFTTHVHLGVLTMKHEFEAWTLNMAPTPGSQNIEEWDRAFIVYSGADDSKLCHRRCVVRSSSENNGSPPIIAELSGATVKGHGAGVTAILPLPVTLADASRVVITGSYDDTIRVFATNHTDATYFGSGRPGRLLGELNLGGGVWRLKLVSYYNPAADRGCVKINILASCMHAGARVVELSGSDDVDGQWVFRVRYRFEEHQSMNYGSDVYPLTTKDGNLLCISTSFYDKLLCLWRADLGT